MTVEQPGPDQPAAAEQRRILSADAGSSSEAFGRTEWALTSVTSLIWGSSFLLIAVSLEAFSPGVLALARVVLGAGALVFFRSARQRILRGDRARIVFIGLVGIALPAYLFSVAEQTIDSAVAGMLVAAVPIASTLIFAVVARSVPGPTQLLGLAIGFIGILLLTWPELWGADAAPLGVGLVLLAVIGYAASNNAYVPVGRRYGGLAVQFWAQLAAIVVLFPLGVAGLSDSSFALKPALALIALGVFATGFARAVHVELITRVGPSRGTIAGYLIPVVALVLGVVFLGDHVQPIQVVGVLIAMSGGWLLSRRES